MRHKGSTHWFTEVLVPLCCLIVYQSKISLDSGKSRGFVTETPEKGLDVGTGSVARRFARAFDVPLHCWSAPAQKPYPRRRCPERRGQREAGCSSRVKTKEPVVRGES